MKSILSASVLLSAVSARIFDGATQRSDFDAAAAHKKYEYIVVGSGAGGGVTAARLALAGKSVLLIDAGGDPTASPLYKVPAAHPFVEEWDQLAWSFFVSHFDNQTYGAGDPKFTYKLTNGSYYTGFEPPADAKPLGILYPRAGGLGGCTSHNVMIGTRPFNSDWEYIQNITGDHKWAPSHMNTYWERLENAHYVANGTAGHGFDGWLQLQYADMSIDTQDPRTVSIIQAAADTFDISTKGMNLNSPNGLASFLNNDVNAGTGLARDEFQGLFQAPFAIQAGTYQRDSTAEWLKAIVATTDKHGNEAYKLDILLNTLVTKVTFTHPLLGVIGNPTATGVDFLTGTALYGADPRRQSGASTGNGTAGSVAASKEVIISGGTFNTPQILKLSGIGPKDELKHFGIKVVKDLPGVGTNLQDRYEAPVIHKFPTKLSNFNNCTLFRPDAESDPCYQQWQTAPAGQKGPYGSNLLQLSGRLRGSTAPTPDSDLYLLGLMGVYYNGYYPGFSMNCTADMSRWTWLTLKAQSRNNAGTVKLNSADPKDVPLIEKRNWQVGGREDLTSFVEGLKFTRKIMENVVPADENGTLVELWPGKDVVSTDDEWDAFAHQTAWGHHVCCTAPIGANNDPNAVLDTKFRVRGVNGLRVVDASAFPKIPSYFLVAPTYNLAEKAAAVILGTD